MYAYPCKTMAHFCIGNLNSKTSKYQHQTYNMCTPTKWVSTFSLGCIQQYIRKCKKLLPSSLFFITKKIKAYINMAIYYPSRETVFGRCTW